MIAPSPETYVDVVALSPEKCLNLTNWNTEQKTQALRPFFWFAHRDLENFGDLTRKRNQPMRFSFSSINWLLRQVEGRNQGKLRAACGFQGGCFSGFVCVLVATCFQVIQALVTTNVYDDNFSRVVNNFQKCQYLLLVS
ncbi:UNVERIFIED_CONTAM: hypothetical protein K2H54_009331 [Gekko kuhli]